MRGTFFSSSKSPVAGEKGRKEGKRFTFRAKKGRNSNKRGQVFRVHTASERGEESPSSRLRAGKEKRV